MADAAGEAAPVCAVGEDAGAWLAATIARHAATSIKERMILKSPAPKRVFVKAPNTVGTSTRTKWLWAAAVLFIIIGVFIAGEHGFQNRVGRELEKAAPVARKVIPPPAKKVLREGRELLPIYGDTGPWIARKAGSVVYFGAVGLFVLAFWRRKALSLWQTLAVTVLSGMAMSTLVEIFEYPEELYDELFDVACGALGGIISGLLAWWWRRRH